ncbi:MAG: GtrA family protein [Limnohabitans sp.]|nr:GtrA family protein [Limnohabitans sp.]
MSDMPLPVVLPSWLRWAEPLLQCMFRWRYLRFATVGASGTVVNIAVLFVMQEWLLTILIADRSLRLSLALVCAIAVATVNNFSWNSLWTWADRLLDEPGANIGMDAASGKRFVKYALSCWLGMLIQYGLTLFLSVYMYYLVANVLSIVVASVSNYLTNDWWTFRQRPVPPGE